MAPISIAKVSWSLRSCCALLHKLKAAHTSKQQWQSLLLLGAQQLAEPTCILTGSSAKSIQPMGSINPGFLSVSLGTRIVVALETATADSTLGQASCVHLPVKKKQNQDSKHCLKPDPKPKHLSV